MASRAQKRSDSLKSEDIGELLDELLVRIDRCKILYEQYFLGIQRTPPGQLHRELERRIRELTQAHIRNTGMRFRFTTVSQKFASYNTYWQRTLKQIESGSYVRDMAKVGRDAIRNGKEIPEELLAKMPKRMRERILRDRDQVQARAGVLQDREDALRESGKVRDTKPRNVHQLDEADLLEDLDLDSIFSGMMSGEAGAAPAPAPAKSDPMAAGKGKARRAEAATDTDVENLFGGAFTEDDTSEAVPLQGRPTPTQAPAGHAPSPRTPPPRTPPPRTPPPRTPPGRVAPGPTAKAQASKPGPPVSTAKPPPGMSEPEAQALFKRYKKARELVGENTTGLSYDKLMNSLNKQAPQILKQHQAKGISFDVVVKGDRVVLKAKPKKPETL